MIQSKNPMPTNYRSTHRARAVRARGPSELFGRGRLLSAAVMLSLLAVAYLARPAQERDLRTQPTATDNYLSTHDGRANLPSDSVDFSASGQPTPAAEFVILSDLASRQQTIRHHLGRVNDQRSTLVGRIGERLVAAFETQATRPPVTFQFWLLADEVQQSAYAYSDGAVLVTAGMVQLAALDNEVAAVLAQSMETVLRARGDIVTSAPLGSASEYWMHQAGFDPNGMRTFHARLASQIRHDDNR